VEEGATAPATREVAPARSRRRFSRSMVPVFAGLTAALLALALVIAQTSFAQNEARTHAESESDALFALNDLMSAMLNAETGQRGFLLTGKADYLAPFHNARQRRERAMARLREIAAKTPEVDMSEDLARLDRMTGDKFGELDRSVALAQSGFKPQALALIQADLGRIHMEAIRREIDRQSQSAATRRRDAFARADALEWRLLPLTGILGLAILGLVYAGFRSEGRRALAEAEAAQADALRAAKEQTELLARELNHRVKNLFAVILSIVALSSRKQAPTDEVVDDIRARIRALSLAHAASQGDYGAAQVELGAVIAKTMEPYADAGGQRVQANGPCVTLPAAAVTPIGLIIHELATNAVKYGALSVPGGRVGIDWRIEDAGSDAPQVLLTWAETGGPSFDCPATSDGSGGFGSRMTAASAAQLGGALDREWLPAGLVTRLRFPLR
jgi:two-component sensor histidine kinase/CHASE3 domain sensor protein